MLDNSYKFLNCYVKKKKYGAGFTWRGNLKQMETMLTSQNQIYSMSDKDQFNLCSNVHWKQIINCK